MSGAAQGDQATTKAIVSDVNDKSQPLNATSQKAPAAQLEEDDEFEDFPVEDWPKDEELGTAGSGAGTTHLWEESWDDDDTSDHFSQQLREELKKTGGAK